jgi:hypothetical protein
MTSVQQRQKLLGLITQACADGGRLKPACRQIGLSCRSVQRWQRTQAAEGDQRPSGKRRYMCPANKLREEERQAVMATLNSEAFKDLPPSQIVPRLARRRLCGVRVHDVPPAAARRPDGPPALGTHSAKAQPATRFGRDRTRSGALLGHSI